MKQPELPTAFPSHALPGAYRDFVDQLAAKIGYDSSIVGLPVLLTLASAIGTSRRIHLGPDSVETPVMRGLVVANNRRALSQALGDAAYPLRLQSFLDRVAESRTIKLPSDQPVQPTIKYPKSEKHYVIYDPAADLENVRVLNPQGILLSNSHFAAFSDVPESCHWVGSPEWKKSLRFPKLPLQLPGDAISVCGGMKPAVVEQELLYPKFRKPLLAQSFLLAFPTRVASPPKGQAFSIRISSQYQQGISRLLKIEANKGDQKSSLPTEMVLSKRARQAYSKYCRNLTTDNSGIDELLIACKSFYCKQVGKLALILELAKWSLTDSNETPSVVQSASLDAAIELVDWFLGELRDAINSVAVQSD